MDVNLRDVMASELKKIERQCIKMWNLLENSSLRIACIQRHDRNTVCTVRRKIRFMQILFH